VPVIVTLAPPATGPKSGSIAVIAGVGWTSALTRISLPAIVPLGYRRVVKGRREDEAVAGARRFGDADFVGCAARVDSDQVTGVDWQVRGEGLQAGSRGRSRIAGADRCVGAGAVWPQHAEEERPTARVLHAPAHDRPAYGRGEVRAFLGQGCVEQGLHLAEFGCGRAGRQHAADRDRRSLRGGSGQRQGASRGNRQQPKPRRRPLLIGSATAGAHIVVSLSTLHSPASFGVRPDLRAALALLKPPMRRMLRR
jgi:hypothetical protein